MSTLATLALVTLALEAAALIALLFAQYRKTCEIEAATTEIAKAVVAPGQSGLPWTVGTDAEGHLVVRAPKASEHKSLYSKLDYMMCALRFQLDAEQRERDRAGGEPTTEMRLVFGGGEAEGGVEEPAAARHVALAS